MMLNVGSQWRKWDLHVHTPASLVNNYGGEKEWDKYIAALEALPSEFAVLGINDYWFLDGYKRLTEERKKGRLKNIQLILPVIEFRIDTFAGTDSHFTRVNYHVIFSPEFSVEDLQSQFVSALSSHITIDPTHTNVRREWSETPTRESMERLGKALYDNLPPDVQAKTHQSMISIGFSNLNVNRTEVEKILSRPHFKGKHLRAIGKTEWWDMKFSLQAIGAKLSVINEVDLVFGCGETPEHIHTATDKLKKANCNHRLLDCSDAHDYVGAKSQPLGKCFTWIKADPTFEGLRQAVFAWDSRVHIGRIIPPIPVHTISGVKLNFDEKTRIGQEAFCLRGKHEIPFSPYLTCIIGGRGTGKSCLLNLILEKLNPGKSDIFRSNKLFKDNNTVVIPAGIEFDSNTALIIEVFGQNEIETLGRNPGKLTEAIITRVFQLDNGKLEALAKILANHVDGLSRVETALKELKEINAEISKLDAEIGTFKSMLNLYNDEEYKEKVLKLDVATKKLQKLRADEERVARYRRTIDELVVGMTNEGVAAEASDNAYTLSLYSAQLKLKEAVLHLQTGLDDPGMILAKEGLYTEIDLVKNAISALLKQRGLTEQNIRDMSEASGRIAELEQQITPLRLLKVARGIIVDCQERTDKYRDEFVKALNTALSQISVDLPTNEFIRKIELKYHFDFAKANQAILTKIIGHCLPGLFIGESQRETHVN